MSPRKLLAVVALLLAGLVGVYAGLRTFLSNEINPAGVGADAPDFTAFTLDEPPKEVTLATYRGDVVLLNVWATWCGPCRVEMPSIEKLHRAYGPRGLKVLAVSVDDAGMAPQIRSFAKEYALTFEILHDSGGQQGNVSRNYQISGYPETVIIGRDGIIRRRLLGAHDWNSAENRALVERLLADSRE